MPCGDLLPRFHAVNSSRPAASVPRTRGCPRCWSISATAELFILHVVPPPNFVYAGGVTNLSPGDRAERQETPPNQHRGRRWLQTGSARLITNDLSCSFAPQFLSRCVMHFEPVQ